MELSADILSPFWQLACTMAYLIGIAAALWRMPWYWIRRAEVANRFAAASVGVMVLWQMRTALPDGPDLHLLGMTILTLAFGWQLAILAGTLVLSVTLAVEADSWGAWGANGLSLILIAVTSSYTIARASERWLPPNLFVYVFAAGFFGAALTSVLVALSAAALLLVSGLMPSDEITGHYLPASLLLLFPEGFLTGGVAAIAAVYKPQWLVSFSDERYLKGR